MFFVLKKFFSLHRLIRIGYIYLLYTNPQFFELITYCLKFL